MTGLVLLANQLQVRQPMKSPGEKGALRGSESGERGIIPALLPLLTTAIRVAGHGI